MSAEPHDHRSARDPNTPPEQLEALLARDPVNLLASVRDNPALSLLQLEHPSLLAAIERADEAVRQKQMAARIMQLPPALRCKFAARCALRVCSLLSEGAAIVEALEVFASDPMAEAHGAPLERGLRQQVLRRAARTLQGATVIGHPACAEDHARLAAAHVANAAMSAAVHAASQASAAVACSGGSLLAELCWQQALLDVLHREATAREGLDGLAQMA